MRALVATDGSTEATAAIDWLSRLPMTWTALRVVTVVTLPPSSIDIPTVRAYYQMLLDDGERVVTAGRDRLRSRCPSVESQVLQGEPREQIVEAVHGWKADLLVVGARGLGGLTGALLGSVSGAVVRRAGCPVLVVKGRPGGLRRVVVGVDGSEDSIAAARFLSTLPLTPGISARLIAVVEPPPLVGQGPFPAALAVPEELLKERRVTVEGILARVAARLRSVTNDVECSVVVGRPAPEIVSAANEPGVDLVVVGARGLGQIRRWLLGSVSERVLSHAECPVLVVPVVA